MGAAVATVLAASAVALPAMAQSPTVNDPPSGSPSGVIYRLPVDSGRNDAAPHKDGDASGGGLPSSTYRSDNNFGTSSVVPGAPQADKDGSGTGGADGAGGGVDLNLTAGTGDTGDPSTPLSLILLVVIVGVGAFLGLTGSRSARRADA